MRKIIFSILCAFSLWGLEACKQGGNIPAEVETDSVNVEVTDVQEKDVKMEAESIDVKKYWERFQEMYEEEDLDDIHYPLTKYAFIDIDEDGVSYIEGESIPMRCPTNAVPHMNAVRIRRIFPSLLLFIPCQYHL